MKRNADDDPNFAAPDSKRMAVTAQLKSFTPHPGVNVSAESVFKGRVTLTWDVQSGGGTATHFIIGAIDATTGARH